MDDKIKGKKPNDLCFNCLNYDKSLKICKFTKDELKGSIVYDKKTEEVFVCKKYINNWSNKYEY